MRRAQPTAEYRAETAPTRPDGHCGFGLVGQAATGQIRRSGVWYTEDVAVISGGASVISEKGAFIVCLGTESALNRQ